MTLSLFAQVRAYTDSLVHASARLDPLTAARHRAFIAPRLVGGLLALTALPVHLAVSGVPGTLEILFYGWLATPILVACYLSRSGQYERAQLMSSASLAALITAVAMATGGITSFAAVWLVVVPLEAALSASRRVVATASAMALGAAALLFAVGEPQSSLGPDGAVSDPDGAWRHLGRALCDRPRARQRVAGADRIAAADRGGRPLPPPCAQHHRRDHTPPPQRHGPVCFAGGRVRCSGCRPRRCSVTACSTACMSPTGRPI